MALVEFDIGDVVVVKTLEKVREIKGRLEQSGVLISEFGDALAGKVVGRLTAHQWQVHLGDRVNGVYNLNSSDLIVYWCARERCPS